MNSVTYELDYSFNPAIIYNRNEIHFQSNLLPNVGDYLQFQGYKAEITSVNYVPSEIRPVRVNITGDEEALLAIRELLTFRLDNDQ